jgi:uncharacterized membrane protein YjfL (UPF0719 family)
MGDTMLEQTLWLIVRTALWAVVGVVLFSFAFWLMSKLSPFSLRKEIEHDQNVATAIVMGSVILGLAIIVAAVIHG